MVNQFTTDFIKVNDGDSTPFTPQDLVQKNALINVIDPEVQWRGVSETTFNTVQKEKTNTDSDRASIETITNVKSNSSSGTTTGDTNVITDSRSKSNKASGQFGGRSGSVTIGKPNIPTTSSSNSSIEIDSIEADYYVKEDSGGSDTGISVEFDDDPYSFEDYDTTVSNISISAREKKRVGGFSQSIGSRKDYNNIVDGASIRFKETGEKFGTSGLVIEIKLNYTVTTIEQTINQETITVTKPPVAPSFTVDDGHDVKVFVDGELTQQRQIAYDPSGVITETSPPTPGSTKKVVIETTGNKRTTVNGTASVNYPLTPGEFSHNQYRIEAFRDGTKVRDDIVYSEREGQTESITSTNPTNEVEIIITASFSKTISTTINTVNPSIEGDFIPEGVNTDNIVLTIDKSSSINNTKQQDIARQVVEQLPDSSNAGLVEFDFDVNIVESLDSLSSNRSDIRDGINSIESSGGTEMVDGLSTARDMLSGVDGSVVLISDGETIDDPTDEAANLGDDGIQIVSIVVDNDNNNEELDLMEELSDVSSGFFFDGGVDAGLFGTTLSDNELSSWQPLNGITRTEQTFTHEIDGTEEAYFRFRFTWEFDTPQPRNGTTGFYDESAGVWREVAVANPDDESLEYNHVLVYNDTEGEWGALDVVDTTNENAIESHQFYDENAGWLAPRENNTV